MGSRGGQEDRSRAEIRALVGRAPVLAFFVVTFAWSWGYWALVSVVVSPASISYLVTLPGLWGPPIAAVTIAWATGSGVRSFLGRALRSGAGGRWYGVAFGGALAVGLVAPLVQGLLAGTGFDVDPLAPIVVTVVALVAGGSEEIGLRGFAHPLLRERYRALRAGLLIGAVWAVWHVPLQRLGVGFDGPILLFTASAVAVSVLLGWLYDSAGGSVLPAVLAHAAIDAPSVLSPSGPVSDDVIRQSQLVTAAVYWLLVVGLVVKNGPRLSDRPSLPPPPAALSTDSGAVASERAPDSARSN